MKLNFRAQIVFFLTLIFSIVGESQAQNEPHVRQLPTGGRVVGGQAILVDGSNSVSANLNINQTTRRAAINWDAFDVGQNAHVHFNQPSADSVTLNRILGSTPSQIFGGIEANGQVFISNANGLYFSPSASVNVGGLVASTHSISVEDFMSGMNTFQRDGSNGWILNEGELSADLGGYIALLAPEVINDGLISAEMGTVALSSGEAITLNLGASGSLVDITATPSQIETLIENRSAVIAPGGTIILSSVAANDIRGGVINHSGEISATSLVEKGGRIFLEGDEINLKTGSQIEARGDTGGGEVLIGGDWQGSGDMHQATTVLMAPSARIDASAISEGNGGTVVLWSDIYNTNSNTTVAGSVRASGGLSGGDGGAIETSGHELKIADTARVDVGVGGLWLLDPTDIVIADSGGTVTPATIESILDEGSDVSLITAGPGSDSGDITVTDNITKSSGVTSTLGLSADNDIIINNTIIDSSGNGLNLTLTADNTVTIGADITNGGSISIQGDSSVTASGGSERILSAGAGNISILTDYLGGGGQTLIIDTTGSFSLVPVSNAFNSGIIGGQLDLTGTLNTGADTFRGSGDSAGFGFNNLSTLGGLTFGKEGGGTSFATYTDWEINGPISLLGDYIRINHNLTANGDIRLSGTFDLETDDTSRQTLTSNNGNISIIMDSDANGVGVLDLDYLTLDAGSGDILIRGETMSWATSTLAEIPILNGSGSLTIESSDAAFGQGIDLGAWFKMNSDASTFSSITVGKSTNTAGVSVNNRVFESTNISVAGPLTMYGSALDLNTDLTVDGDVTLQANTTDVEVGGSITQNAVGTTTAILKAQRHVNLETNGSMTATSGATNTQLWADTDADGDGIVFIESSGITTAGGSLTFGESGQTASIGGETVLVGGDVFFQRGSAQTLNTGGGTFNLYGETIISNTSGLTLNTSGGDARFHGLVNSGNAYTYVDKTGSGGSGSWTAARTEAINGTGGGSSVGDSYLINITSRLENSIGGLVADYQGAWIGARRPDPTNSYNWEWVDGPEAGEIFFIQSGTGGAGGGTAQTGWFSNFGTSEPNGGLSASAESVGQFFGSEGQWNDLRATEPYSATQDDVYAVLGFVRETNLAASPLTINAGAGSVTVDGGVGTRKAFSTIDVTAATATINGDGLASTSAQDFSGNLNIAYSGNGELTGGTVTVGGTLTGSLSGTLTQNAALASTTDLALTGSTTWDLTANQTLATLNMGSGTSISNVNEAASLTVTGTSTLANTVSTGSSQTYGGAVTLAADTTLSTINSDITFNSTVDSDSPSTPRDLTANIAAGTTYYWVDWDTWDGNTASATTVTGTITIGMDTINVTYSNPNGIFNAQTSSGTDYWTFTGNSPYTSSEVANGPSGSDIIQLQYQGDQTLTFDQSVENLAFSVVSMNGNGYGFDQDFDLVAYTGFNGAGSGFWGTGDLAKEVVDGVYQLNDVTSPGPGEPHGTIRFANAFDTLRWESLSSETWNGFTVGVTGTTASAGALQFNGLVGNTAGLGNLDINRGMETTATIVDAASLDVSGRTTLGANITTSGNQVFNSQVVLNSNATLTTTDNGSINTFGTISGAQELTITTNGTGDTLLSRGVDGATALTITTDALTSDALSLASSSAIAITNTETSAVDGIISGTGVTVEKAGSGTLALNQTNTYSGATTVSAGILQVGTTNAFGSGAVSVSSGAAIDLAGNSFSNDLSLAGAGVSNSGALYTSASGAINVANTVTLTADSRISNESGGSLDLSGTVNGAFGLTVDTDGSSVDSDVTISGIVGGSSEPTGLTIIADTADANMNAAVNTAGPVSISAANVALNADITATASGADVLLKADDNITLATNSDILTNGGDITLWSNADDGGGYITLEDATSLDSRTNSDRGSANIGTASGGGNITLGGGSAGVDTPTGSALKAVTDQIGGIELGSTNGGSSIEIYSGGGDITLRGNSTAGHSSGESNGVFTREGITVDAGDVGDITIEGQASNGTFNAGIYTSYTIPNVADVTFTTHDGNITLNGGSLGGGASGNRGMILLAGSGRSLDIVSTGTGYISLNGNGSSDNIFFQNTVNVLAGSGAIDIIGTGSGTINSFGADLTVGYRSGELITASTSNIILSNDTVPFGSGAGVDLNTSGTIGVWSFGDSFTNMLIWQTSDFNLSSDVSGLSIGKATNTANVTILNDETVAGPIEIYGGDFIIDAALTATNETITLDGSGNITDGTTGYLVADNLLLLDGAVTLDNASNNVNTLAGSGLDSLEFSNADALQIGTIDSTNGLSGSGTIEVTTRAGDLTLSQSITNTNTSSSALTLNAGADTAAGTSSGGNIIISGSPTISLGSGGRATLFSGSVSGSTGLTDFIGSGSGRFRYNSDETATNYTTSLSAGNYAVYREQPTVAGTISSETITYGDTNPSFTFTGTDPVNGDDVSGVTYVSASYSTGSFLNVGTYAVAGSEYANLGYNTASLANGLLTVEQLDLAVTGMSAGGKVYDASTTASLSGTAAVSQLSGDVLTLGGSGSAVFSDKNVGSGKSVTVSGYSLSGTDASNYNLIQPAGLTADITPASLTITGLAVENKVYDAGTTASVDTSAIAYTGLISGDDLSISSSEGEFESKNVGTEIDVVLSNVYGGADLGNYTIADQTSSTADITKADLLVTGVLAEDKVYDATTVALLSGDASITAFGNDDLLLSGNALAEFSDKNVGEGKTVTITGFTLTGDDAANYTLIQPSEIVADIIPAGLVLSGVSAEDKVYNAAEDAALSGTAEIAAISGDDVSLEGVLSAVFSDKNVGEGKSVTVSGVGLAGDDASNYSLMLPSDLVADITPANLVISGLTAVDKVYDGNTVADISAQGLVLSGLFTGDDVKLDISGNFENKDVGDNKSVTIDTEYSGLDFGNYLITAQVSTVASISRLDTVSWIGGAMGNWFDPANWAGGAVPDLSNVASVIIPTGVVVDFDSSGVVAPAQAGEPVEIESLGSSGGISQADGTLNIGSGGMNLGSFSQRGGVLSNEGSITVGDYRQTGGSVSSGGDVTIQAVNGPVVMGNISVGGSLDIDSLGGDIEQTPGTGIQVGGNTELLARTGGAPADINLGGSSNDFGGSVNGSGANIVLADSQGGIMLGDITSSGTLNVLSRSGPITQIEESRLFTSGASSFVAEENGSSSDIVLGESRNNFVGPISVSGDSIDITDSEGGLILGDLTGQGVLDVVSTGGPISQGLNASLFVLGNATFNATDGSGRADTLLNDDSNDFVGSVSIVGADIEIVDENDLELGSVDADNDLQVSAEGDVNQTPASSISVGGVALVNSTRGDVNLNEEQNDFSNGLTTFDSSTSNQLLNVAPSAPVSEIPVVSDASPVSESSSVANSSTALDTSIDNGSTPIPDSAAASNQGGAASTTASDDSSSGTSSGGVSGDLGAGLSMDLVDVPTENQTGLVSVILPAGTSTSGTGFSFTLPEEVATKGTTESTIKVSLSDGSGLPNWLEFDSVDNTFTASAVPQNGLPLTVIVEKGGIQTTIILSERAVE